MPMFAENAIMNDMSRSIWDRAQDLLELKNSQEESAPGRSVTVMDIVRGSIGAAFGGGLARGLGRIFGLGDNMVDKLETLGMGAGALMNTDVKLGEAKILHKYANALRDQREQAFRLGFVGGLVDSGYFTKKGFLSLNLSPATFFIPAGIAALAVHKISEMGGSTAALLTDSDSGDQAVAQSQAEKVMYNEQAKKLKAEKKSRVLGDIIRRRVK